MSAELEAALARAGAAVARAAEATRAEPADRAVVAALTEAARSATAPAERHLGERVEQGRLDWDEVWGDPYALGPDAVRLVQRAVVLAARDLGRALL